MEEKDYTELARSHERLRVLAAASDAFAKASTDYRRLLDTIARTLADVIGDGGTVTLLDTDGETLFNAASAHRDPVIEADYRTYLANVGLAKRTSPAVSATVVRTGEPRLVAAIDPATVVAQAEDALKPLVARMNVHGFVVVPIRARDTIIGSISLFRSGPVFPYGADDLTLLSDLADRAGLAIENARLYDMLEQRVRVRTTELEAANAKLERAAVELATVSVRKSTFLANMSHELRTPLNAIIGFTELMYDGVIDRDAPETTEFLGDVLASGRHLLQLVNSILDLSKIEAGKLEFVAERIRLSKVVDEVVAVLKPALLKRHITIDVTVAADTDEVTLDPARLKQVLYNYVSNAIKFTPERGRITIRIVPDRDEMVCIEVEDTGVGLTRDEVSRLFVEFHQTSDGKAIGGGTGLGLALTKRIVEAQGGSVGVRSERGRGSVFHAMLPRTFPA